MAVRTRGVRWAAFATALMMLYTPVLCGEYLRGKYVKIFESRSLTAVSTEIAASSHVRCKYECLLRLESGACSAYEWDADTGNCRLQETLQLTAPSVGNSVGVFMDSDHPAACIDNSDCPGNHTCQIQDSACDSYCAVCAVPVDCAAILAAYPSSQSGVYDISGATEQTHKVWCDMLTDGGGWTVFLKRLDGSGDFYQNMAAYKQGFGDVSGEYWLGLDVLHALTSSKTNQVRADISDWAGSSVHSLYASMLVDGETDDYRLTMGAFTEGEGGYALEYFDGMAFTAKDFERDLSDAGNCAQIHHGGFWYQNCLKANPTGRYYVGGAYTNTDNDGIQWRTWAAHNDFYYSMKTVELKLRP